MATKKTPVTRLPELVCASCGGGPFGILEKDLGGHFLGFVRCEACHVVVHAFQISPDYSEITSALADVEAAVNDLGAKRKG